MVARWTDGSRTRGRQRGLLPTEGLFMIRVLKGKHPRWMGPCAGRMCTAHPGNCRLMHLTTDDGRQGCFRHVWSGRLRWLGGLPRDTPVLPRPPTMNPGEVLRLQGPPPLSEEARRLVDLLVGWDDDKDEEVAVAGLFPEEDCNQDGALHAMMQVAALFSHLPSKPTDCLEEQAEERWSDDDDDDEVLPLLYDSEDDDDEDSAS